MCEFQRPIIVKRREARVKEDNLKNDRKLKFTKGREGKKERERKREEREIIRKC